MNETLLMLLVVGGCTLVLLLGFILLRSLMEKRRAALARRLSVPDSSVDSILVEQFEQSRRRGPVGKDKAGIGATLDLGFIRMIERTGLRMSAEQALGIICLVGVILATVLYLWRGELWLVMIGLVVGLLVPLGVFAYLQTRWRWQLQQQLPDAFFLLARSLRAGLSFDQAIELAGSEGLEPLAAELRRCSEKINLGLTVPAALQSTAKRLQLLDFNVFTSVISLHRNTGGNLSVLLDRLAQSTRDRNQYHGYFRSATALGRMTALAIGLAVPAIFVGYAILEPSYAARFFESVAGMTALAVAFGLEIVGAVWLYYLLRVEY